MGIDINDPRQVRLFKEQQLSKGRDPRRVDDFLNKRRRQEQIVKATEAGIITRKEAVQEGGFGLTERISSIVPKKEKKPLTGAAAKTFGIVKGGITQLSKLKKSLDIDTKEEGVQRGLKTFGKLLGRKLDFTEVGNLQADLSDRIGRLRSGGAINEKEEARFLGLLPTAADSEELINSKLAQIEEEFSTVGRALGISDEELGLTSKKKDDLGDAEAAVGGEQPSTFGTPAEQIAEIRRQRDAGTLGQPSEAIQQETISTIAPEKPETDEEKRTRRINNITEALPTIGGILGGITGAGVGALAGGVGALPGGAIGTAGGTLAGRGLAESIQTLLGVQADTDMEQLKKQAVEPAIAGGMDLVTGGLFGLLGKGISKVGSKLLSIADDIPLRTIRATTSQQRKFTKKTGVAMKDFIVEKGLFKRGVEQADEIIAPLQQQFDDIALKSGRGISINDIGKSFDQEIFKLAGEPFDNTLRTATQMEEFIKTIDDEGLQNVAKKLLKKRDVFLTARELKGKVIMGVDELTKLRRKVDKTIVDSAFTDPTIKHVDRTVRDIYQNSVRDAAEDIVGPGGLNIRDLGTELNKIYSFRDIVEQQAGLGKGTLPINLIRGGAAGTGAIAGLAAEGDLGGALKGAAIGLGVPALLNNPKFLKFAFDNMGNIGRALEGVPEKTKAKIMADMFRRMLTQLGAVEMSKFGEDEEISGATVGGQDTGLQFSQ